MPRRQQRTNNARGTLQPQNITIAGQMDWEIVGASGGDAEIDIPTPDGEIVAKTMPRLYCIELASEPIGWSWSGTRLHVNYAVSLPSLFKLELPAYDPGIRSSNGGYLAAGTRQFPVDRPPTVGFVGTGGTCTQDVPVFSGAGGDTVILGPDVEGTILYLVAPAQMTSNIFVTGTGYSGTQNPGVVQTYAFTGGAWVLV